MSAKHPIIAVTGASGAGTTTVKNAFEHIFFREKINPLVVEGDSYHRYDRAAMKEAMTQAETEGNTNFSHFGPEANLFDKLEELFKTYGETGGGQKRLYLHSDEEAEPYEGLTPGQFTPWEDIPTSTDLMFYEGLHGGVATDEVDVAAQVDLLVGVALGLTAGYAGGWVDNVIMRFTDIMYAFPTLLLIILLMFFFRSSKNNEVIYVNITSLTNVSLQDILDHTLKKGYGVS